MNETAQKILGYIKRLPETWDGQPLRQQALDNFDENFYDGSLRVINEIDFINYCFNWDTTKEEEDYWCKIYYLIMDGTIQLLPEGEEKKEEKKEEFVWTDELVEEVIKKAIENATKINADISAKLCIDDFKASKQRKPLFVTEDGVGMFEGDEYWFISLTTFNVFHDITVTKDSYYEGKKFSTEAAAIEYVRLNKPMYSLNDIGDSWEKLCHEAFTYDQLIAELEKLKA